MIDQLINIKIKLEHPNIKITNPQPVNSHSIRKKLSAAILHYPTPRSSKPQIEYPSK